MHTDEAYVGVGDGCAKAASEALRAGETEGLPAAVEHPRRLAAVSPVRLLRSAGGQLGPGPEDAGQEGLIQRDTVPGLEGGRAGGWASGGGEEGKGAREAPPLPDLQCVYVCVRACGACE
jgi:hypothetical protein